MLPSWESLQVAVMMGAARAQDAHQHSYAIKAGRKLPGGSVRSATMVSPKSKAHLFPPALSTFISSLSLLLDGVELPFADEGVIRRPQRAIKSQSTSCNHGTF